MTKKDFFVLLIKLFGLFFMIKALFALSVVLRQLNIVVLISSVIACAAIFGLFWLLVISADKLVDFLKLEKGLSEERIDFGNMKSRDIIKIGTFVIGGLLIVENIPEFLGSAILAIRSSFSEPEFDSYEKMDLIESGLSILLGYVLLTNYQFAAKLVDE